MPNRFPAPSGAMIDPAKMDLNLLRILAMLLHTRSVTAAAEQLGMTQPAVSRALARLRDLFNDPLLIRSQGQMQVTHYASRLAAPLATWMGQLSGLVALAPFSPASLARRFRIAVSDYGAQACLIPAMARFRHMAPLAAWEILPLERSSPRALALGEIDLILSGSLASEDQFHQCTLFRDDFLCLMAPDHPWLAEQNGDRMELPQWLAYPHIGITMMHEGKELVQLFELDREAKKRRLQVSVPYFHLAPALLADDLLLTLPRRLGQALSAAGLTSIQTCEAPAELPSFAYRAFWSERSRSDEAADVVVGPADGAYALNDMNDMPADRIGKATLACRALLQINSNKCPNTGTSHDQTTLSPTQLDPCAGLCRR